MGEKAISFYFLNTWKLLKYHLSYKSLWKLLLKQIITFLGPC